MSVQKKDQNLVITKCEHECLKERPKNLVITKCEHKCPKERPKLDHYQNISINV